MSHKLKNILKFKLGILACSSLILSAIIVTTYPGYGQQLSSCSEHEISTDKCFFCDPSLREDGRLWCQEHNRYEDRCWLCHSELQDKDRLFCEEHSLYEDECFLCHPKATHAEIDDAELLLLLPEEPVVFCSEHGINTEQCFYCDPSLRDKGRLWCQEHDRYEDRCWLCHSEIQDHDRLFCVEHSLYEDECFICHPEITQTEEGAVEGIVAEQSVLFCNEHEVPEQECGICQPQLASTLEAGHSLKIRFASEESADKAGIRSMLPSEGLSAPAVEAFCEAKYNGNALARITPLASGVIRRVLVDVGRYVDAGEILIEINSAEIAEAKASFLAALADVEVKKMASQREETLVNEKISALRDYQEAKAKYEIARLTESTAHQKLLNYGFTEAEVEQIEETNDSSSSFAVKAPFAGTLVDRNAVVGEFVNRGDALFTVANLQDMWLELSIPAHQAGLVRQGLRVEAEFDSRAGFAVEGKLIWVATSIDRNSRMLNARALIPNENGNVKSGMFGKVKVNGEGETKIYRISKDSIQRIEGNPFVFVKEAADLYSLRRVVLGNMNGDMAEVLSGIESNDQIVTEGSFIVFSEFFKSRLGAGCTDD